MTFQELRNRVQTLRNQHPAPTPEAADRELAVIRRRAAKLACETLTGKIPVLGSFRQDDPTWQFQVGTRHYDHHWDSCWNFIESMFARGYSDRITADPRTVGGDVAMVGMTVHFRN